MEGLDTLKIGEEKKKYILEQLNPVLEEIVAECIHRMPADPVPFILALMEQKRVEEADKVLSPADKEKYTKENAEIEKQLAKLKSQVHEASKMAATSAEHHKEESEEEDDVDDEPPPNFDKPQGAKARTSVSAEAYGEWNAKKKFVPPLISKTDEQKDRLREVLKGSFLFSTLDANDLGIVIGAMKEVSVDKGKRVIQQGDPGDFLFVVESGKLDCLIHQAGGSEKVVKTCQAGDVFGELALLYNVPRAASVDCTEKAVLWRLDRETFNNIVKEAAQKKRDRYDSFLKKVPLLASMDAYERSQLADALVVESFNEGQTIMTQGEIGNKFYILEDGEAVAKKNGVEVMNYSHGDYFGELALIKNQPRAATVVCKTPAKVLSVDAKSFKRLFNVSDLMDRTSRYS
jgi:cAMP-dependent protein kinase regulator